MNNLLAILLIFSSTQLFASKTNQRSLELIEKINYAAKTNNIPLIKEYIKLGGDLNIQDHKGYSPLIFAAYYGHENLVSLLLAEDANPCLKDKRGNTALMGAIFKGNISIAYKLMKSDCIINQKNNVNQTALMYAALFNRKDIAKKLIEKGEKVSDKDIHGNTAIGVAKKQFNKSMVEFLRTSSIKE